MSATKPLCEGIANDHDHFANFFMQDTVLKVLEKVLLDSSRTLANLTAHGEPDEESEKATKVHIVLQITNVSC